jgi:hypothetical protein
MNKHFTNKNLLRGITGLAIAGLAGAALSAGSVAASGTEICWETGPNGLPRIVDCPPEFSFPLPGFTPALPEVNLGNDVDYGALLDYLGNTDENDEADEADEADAGFGGIELPTPIDPEVFEQSVPELVNPERFEIDPDTITPLPDFPDVEPENPFLGTDDDAEPELAQPEAEVAPEVAPEPQPEVAPEVAPEAQPEVAPEVAPEAQPEVRVNNSEVAPEELPATPETVTPEVVTPEAVTPEIIVPDTDADTDINFDADVDRTADLDDAGLVEAAPVEVFTTDDTTGGANLGLYAGILLILGGGGSLAAIAATRRNRD